jgi:hypothetical protein
MEAAMKKSAIPLKKPRARISTAVACAGLIMLLSTVSCSSGSDEPGGPTADIPSSATEALDILRNLGVKEVDNPPNLVTTTTTGSKVTIADPSAWHPLKKPYTVYGPRAEVFQFGLNSGGRYHAMYQDGKNSPSYETSYPIPGNEEWEQNAHKVSVAADLDGDGLDEIAVFYILEGKLYLRVYDDGSFSSALQVSVVGKLSDALDTWMAASTRYPIDYLQAGSGDLDGDGNDELIFVNYASAYLLEVNAAGSTARLIDSRDFASPIRTVATGDTDGDKTDEIAICLTGGQIGCYDSSFSMPLTASELISFGNPAVDACFGDFDADNLDELAVAYGDTMHYYEDFSRSSSLTEKWSHAFTPNDDMELLPGVSLGLYFSLPCLRSLDYDGNGYADTFIAGTVYLNPHAGSPTSVQVSDFFTRQSQVGDVDGDGKDDIIVAEFPFSAIPDFTSGIRYKVTIDATAAAYGQSPSGALETKKTYPSCTIASSINSDVSVAVNEVLMYPALSSGRIAIAAGNVDNDSPRIRYAGHKLLFTDPVIIAVLAAPPYWSDVAAADGTYAGEYTNWETAYGTLTAMSSSFGASAGFSIGSNVEFEQSASVFGVKMATVKASASFKQSFNYSVASDFSISKSVTYKGTNGEDRIIFTSVPMDIYSYEVVDSPSGEGIGSILAIELPRNFSTYSVTRNFFNANNGIVADIDGDVLQHSPGQPFSYPDAARKNSLLAAYGGYSSAGTSAVAEGVSTTALDIVVDSGETRTIDLETEIELQGGGGAGGIVVLATAGFTVGFNYSTSTSSGTTFGGTVGYLPSAYYNQARYVYSSGLFAYPFFDSRDNRSYWIVNYWQE